MKNKPSFLLLIFLIASIVNSSRGYGNKKFSQSYSSSSASSHASSYSSSSSYTIGSGHDPKQISAIGVIPQANAIATASATAGGATATANAAASAHSNVGAIGTGNQFGSGSYLVGNSHSAANTNGGSYPLTHSSHNIIGTGSQEDDGSYSAEGDYSGTATNGGSGTYSNSHGKKSQVISSSIGAGSQFVSGSYTGEGSRANTVRGGSYPYNHGVHQSVSTGSQVKDGSYSAGGYVGTNPSSYGYGRDRQAFPNTVETESLSGGGLIAAGVSKSTATATNTDTTGNSGFFPNNPATHPSYGFGSQVKHVPYSPGGHSSINAGNAYVSGVPHSYSQGERAPNTFSAGSQSESGSYSAAGGKYAHTGSYPYNTGSQNSIGTETQREDGSQSVAGHSTGKSTNANFDTGSYSYSKDKDGQQAPNVIGAGGLSESGSNSAGGSKTAAAANTQTVIGDGSYSYNQGPHSTITTGSQVKDGSYLGDNYNSASASSADSGASSHSNNAGKNIPGYIVGGTGSQDRDSSYSSGGFNTVTNNAVGSYSNNKDNQGAYHVVGSGSFEKEGSYSSGGHSFGSAVGKGSSSIYGTKQPDYSFEKKYFQPVSDDTAIKSQPEVRPLSKPTKPVFPGPDGSIYDYKIPSQQNHVHTPHRNSGFSQSSGVAQSGSYGGFQSIASSGNNEVTKPCCKGPFPGPSGSIYDSKSSSAVGTAIKTSVSHPPLARVTPKTTSVNFPGPSGSIYNSKPVVGNINQDRKKDDKWSSSASSGTYQKQQDSSPLQPSHCTQNSCTNIPKKAPQITPLAYLEPPVVIVKPVVENVKDENKSTSNTLGSYMPPLSSSNVVPHELVIKKPETDYKPHISTTEIQIVPTHKKPHPERISQTADKSIGEYVVPEIQSNVNSASSGTSLNSGNNSAGLTSKHEHTDVLHSQISTGTESSYVGNVKPGYQSGFTKTPSIFGDDSAQNGEDKNVYLSNPVEGYAKTHSISGLDETQSSYSTGSAAVSRGLQEGPQGSPFQVTQYQNKELTSGSSTLKPINTVVSIQPTHYKSTDEVTPPKTQFQLNNGLAAVQNEANTPQISSGSFSFADANSHSGTSKVTISTHRKGTSGDSRVTYGIRDSIAKPVDITTTIEKQVPKIYQNSNRDIIIEPVDISTTVVKQVPKVYTSTLYIDLNKPSPATGADTIIFQEPESLKPIGLNKKTDYFINSGLHGLEAQTGSSSSRNTYSSSGSQSYGSSSKGFSSNSAHRCTIPGCGTSYRPYSNALPSSVAKTSVIHVGVIPSSGYSVGSDKSQSVAGSYAGTFGSQNTAHGYGGSEVGSHGFSSSGSYGGTFPKKSLSPDGSVGGAGGFLSSIYLDGGSGATANADAYANAGSHSSSGSYSKSNSYASSSSFASSSSGSYSSHGY